MFPALLSLTKEPSGVRRSWIPRGDAGTEQTVARMRELVTQGKRDPRFRPLLAKLLTGCDQKDYRCYATAAFHFVRDKIKYVYDPVAVEWIEEPYAIIQNGIGDCDSKDILLTTLFEIMGFPARFKVIKADARRPDEFSHVYTQVKLPKEGWLSADPTMPNKPFGWEPPGGFPFRLWPASLDGRAADVNDMSCCCPLAEAPSLNRELLEVVQSHTPMSSTGDQDFVQPDSPYGVADYYVSNGDGMGDLGLEWDVLDIYSKMIDGTYSSQIRRANQDLIAQQKQLTEYSGKIRLLSQADQAKALTLLGQARSKVFEGMQQVRVAQGRYDFLRGELARWSISAPPSGINAVQIPAAVTVGIYAAAAIAMATAISIALDAVRGGEGLLTQMGNLLGKLGVAVEQAGTAAMKTSFSLLALGAVAVAAYVFLPQLKSAAGRLRR